MSERANRLAQVILQDGFCVEKGTLQQSMVNTLIQRCRWQQSDPVKSLHWSDSRLCEMFLAETGAVALYRAAFGVNPSLVQLTFDPKPPGRWGHAPHRDSAFLNNQSAVVAALIALDDWTASTGPITFAKGSHLSATTELNFAAVEWRPTEENGQVSIERHIEYQEHPRLEHPLLAKGDTLFWLGDTFHASTANTDEELCRRVLIAHLVPENVVGLPSRYRPIRLGAASNGST